MAQNIKPHQYEQNMYIGYCWRWHR